MNKALSLKIMNQALKKLDSELKKPLKLIIGGGGAMILAHSYPLSTSDIDAIPLNYEISDLDPFIKKIAKELNLPGDWLNPYFSSFSHVLPVDYSKRLVEVFNGIFLNAHALGKEDMLIMKCFAHRAKDVGHVKALLKQKVDTQFVEEHLLSLQDKNVMGVDRALDFFDEQLDAFEGD